MEEIAYTVTMEEDWEDVAPTLFDKYLNVGDVAAALSWAKPEVDDSDFL